MKRSGPRPGEGRLGCIIWLLVLAAFALVCFKAIPVKIKSAELYDYMEEQAKFAGSTSSEILRQRIIKRAGDLGLPVKPKDVMVERAGGRIRMTVSYTVLLEFPAYTYRWSFTHEVDRPIFVI